MFDKGGLVAYPIIVVETVSGLLVDEFMVCFFQPFQPS